MQAERPAAMPRFIVNSVSNCCQPGTETDSMLPMQLPFGLVAGSLVLTILLAILVIVLTVRVFRLRAYTSGSDATTTLALVEERLKALTSMSEQLQDLNRVFAVPRTRGEVGETMLAELLGQYLPRDAFDLQYGYPDGSRVDAIIHLADAHIPIDSKFPLEAIRSFLADNPSTTEIPKTIRKGFTDHAKAIQSRYIQPESGTTPYALMYVPSEGLYHRLFVTDASDTMREMLTMRVIPVSPGTLFLYLLTVAHAMRGISFQSRVSELADLVAAVRRMLDETEQAQSVLRTHLKNALKAASETDRKFDRLGTALDRLEGR